jgi:hypothetical protein
MSRPYTDNPLRVAEWKVAALTLTQSGRERKLRLLAAAWLRLFGGTTAGPVFEQTIDAIERYADGTGTKAALKRARQGLRAVRYALPESTGTDPKHWVPLWLAEVAATERAIHSFAEEIQRLMEFGSISDEFCPYLIDVSQCVVGQFPSPVQFDMRWRGTNTTEIARAIYDDRAFDRLPILADALLDAGCEVPEILDHCRSSGPHVRGCWVVDLVLGKE